jgi:hypothetical protein
MKSFTFASTTCGSNAQPANFTVVCAAAADVPKRVRGSAAPPSSRPEPART